MKTPACLLVALVAAAFSPVSHAADPPASAPSAPVAVNVIDPCAAPGPDAAANGRCALKFAQRAEAEGKAGQREAALASLTLAASFAPDDLRYAIARAELSLAGKTPPTPSAVDAALRAAPDDAGLLMLHGMMSLQAHRYDATLADTARVVAQHPGAALPHELRAQTYLEQEHYADASAEVDQALALAPASPDGLRMRGNLRTISGDYAGALADVEAAHRAQPQRDDAFLVGGTQFLNRRFAESAATLAVSGNATADGQYWTLWRYLALARSQGPVAARGALGPGSTPGGSIAWPGAVIDFYLGTIDGAALLADAKAAQTAANLSQVCEAHFYLGEEALLRYRHAEAMALFRTASAECPHGFHEYVGAQAELKAAAAEATAAVQEVQDARAGRP